MNLFLEGEAASGVTVSGLLSEAGTTIASAISTVWNIITANPVLTLFVGAMVLSLGFTFFRKAKRAAGNG